MMEKSAQDVNSPKNYLIYKIRHVLNANKIKNTVNKIIDAFA